MQCTRDLEAGWICALPSVPRLNHIQRQCECPIAPRQLGRQHRPQLGQRVRYKRAGQQRAALVIGLMGTADVLAGMLGVRIGQRLDEPFSAGCSVVVHGLSVGGGQQGSFTGSGILRGLSETLPLTRLNASRHTGCRFVSTSTNKI